MLLLLTDYYFDYGLQLKIRLRILFFVYIYINKHLFELFILLIFCNVEFVKRSSVTRSHTALIRSSEPEFTPLFEYFIDSTNPLPQTS